MWAALYWAPQVAGALCFVASSLLFMVEAQPRGWLVPAPTSIGWQVGFWNLVGSVGFLLSGAFGLLYPTGRLQVGGTAASTFWGSYAFLIGSYLQLLESVNKHVEALRPAAWRAAAAAAN